MFLTFGEEKAQSYSVLRQSFSTGDPAFSSQSGQLRCSFTDWSIHNAPVPSGTRDLIKADTLGPCVLLAKSSDLLKT